MLSRELRIDTSGRRVTDLTYDARRFCAAAGDGFLNVFVPHATAGVALMETGSGSEADLSELVGRLFPRDDRYVHSHGARGHGADHVIPALISPSVVIPVVGGDLRLGTWQSLVLVDFNEDNPVRRVLLSFLQDAPGPLPS